LFHHVKGKEGWEAKGKGEGYDIMHGLDLLFISRHGVGGSRSRVCAAENRWKGDRKRTVFPLAV